MKSENNININEIKMLKCPESKCPFISSIYIKFKQNKEGVDNLYITCFDNFHEYQLLLKDYLNLIKNENIIKNFVCSDSQCTNRLITDNSFYYCLDCNNFFCPNHKEHNAHNNINKIKVLNKICIEHNSNKGIKYCQNCHKLICSLCEIICIRNNHKFEKKLEKNELKEKENLIVEHEKNLNTIKETINELNFVNEDNKEIIDNYFEINNLLLTLMKLLIKLYKKDDNEKMVFNIRTIFNFSNYFEKFNEAKDNKDLLLRFFANYKINSILIDKSEGTATLKNLEKNPYNVDIFNNNNYNYDNNNNNDNNNSNYNNNNKLIENMKAVEVPINAQESLLYKNIINKRKDIQKGNNLNNMNFNQNNNINEQYYYNNNNK